MSAASQPPQGTEATAATLRRWSFGEAVLDERTLELRVRGELTELERKPLEVLIYLLAHAGEVVTKDELAEALWPGRILTETVLTRCISLLRQALHDDAREIIKTVHGYGYRLVAPVRVEALSAPAPPPRFAFKPSDEVPLRPQWRLEQRLGAGGHGEVWLGRHEKTREARVYKFALEGAALTALKREITLYRLLHDTLGERPDLVRIMDWNLQEAPFFIESEYVSGGSLLTWADTQGGIEKVPLVTRLELLAQVAEGLAAAHAVGVLHKDLKPGNVLIVAETGQTPRIKLTDFGSGGMLEPGRLDALGITQLGFTRALAADELTSGTPWYIAPEVMAGQPPTVQADIYALGVMLYQLCVADLSRPLAPGWEHDVADELLREDIALAADGNRSRRLADAAELATRLRSLDARRSRRAAERATQVELERARQGMERLRARRAWMLTAMAVLVIGLAASLWLYLEAKGARNEALSAAATTKTVSEFLNKELLTSADPSKAPTRDVRVKDLIDRAAATVDQRFALEPEAAAQVHASLAESYYWLSQPGAAEKHARRAAEMFERLRGRQAQETLSALALLAKYQSLLNHLPEALALRQEVQRGLEARLGAHHPRVLEARGEVVYTEHALGYYRQATAAMAALVRDSNQAQPPLDALLLNEWKRMLGWMLWADGDFAGAEKGLREVLDERVRLLGDKNFQTGIVRYNLGRVLSQRGLYAEAEVLLQKVLHDLRQWLGDEHNRIAYSLWALGELRLEQGRADEAVALLDDAMRRQLAVYGPQDQDSAWLTYILAQAYQRQGRLEEARQAFTRGLEVGEKLDGPGHPVWIGARIDLADVLREQGRTAEARAILKAIPPQALQALPDQHPFLANLRRVEGLLSFGDRRFGDARTALTEALQIYQLRYGSQHWRSARTRAELAQLPPP